MVKILGERANADKDYVIRGLELFDDRGNEKVYIKNNKSIYAPFTFYHVYLEEKLIYVTGYSWKGRRLSGILKEIIN